MSSAKLKFQIKSRWTENILFEGEYDSIKKCVTDALKKKINLRGADLRAANLVGAKLAGAKLIGANLGRANLRGADLRDANLGRANLGGADLRDANLGGANLVGADLRDANLGGADIRDANLGGAKFRRANLRDANLRDANLKDANLADAKIMGANLGGANLGKVPFINDIHKTLYSAVSKLGALDMSVWHSCGTTHCRAGWVVALAGDAGAALESRIGTPAAAALIYLKSDPKIEKIPDFYCDNETALADIKRLAEAD